MRQTEHFRVIQTGGKNPRHVHIEGTTAWEKYMQLGQEEILLEARKIQVNLQEIKFLTTVKYWNRFLGEVADLLTVEVSDIHMPRVAPVLEKGR